jgi:plasmid stabilization system protein ParE
VVAWFRDEIRAAFRRIAATPTLYPIVHQQVRRAVVHRFPYSVLYKTTKEAILVVAIVHQARHPRVWQQRS